MRGNTRKKGKAYQLLKSSFNEPKKSLFKYHTNLTGFIFFFMNTVNLKIYF